MGRVLGSASIPWVLASAASSILAILLRAQRWRLLLAPVAAVPLAPAFSATAIGFAATAVLPLRLGEVIRPAVLARRVGFGVSPALSSVVLERLFDMLFVVLCFLVLSRIYPLPADLRRAALVLGAVAVLGFVVLLVASRNRPRAERMLDVVVAWLPAAAGRVLRPLAMGFLDALGALESLRIVGGVVGYSTVLWAANALPFLFGFLALGIDVPLLSASLACIVIVAAFVFMPQAPGVSRHLAGRLRPGARPLRGAEGHGRGILAAHVGGADAGERGAGRILRVARGRVVATAGARRRAGAGGGGRVMSLDGRRILVGLSGGIACYKACELVRLLARGGARGACRDDRGRAGVRRAAHPADALRPARGHRHLQPDAGVGDRPHPARRRGGAWS